jgi:hypothetical protein
VQLIQKPEGFIEIREQLDLAESFGAAPSQRCQRTLQWSESLCFCRALANESHAALQLTTHSLPEPPLRMPPNRPVRRVSPARPTDTIGGKPCMRMPTGRKRTLLCTLRANVHLFSNVFGA